MYYIENPPSYYMDPENMQEMFDIYEQEQSLEAPPKASKASKTKKTTKAPKTPAKTERPGS